MKKIVFITAILAFVAGSTFAVSSYYTGDVTTIEKVESNKGDKEKKSTDKKSDSEATKGTSNSGKKECASKAQCCKKGAKANCSDDKKKDKE